MKLPYRDRSEAGWYLATLLDVYADRQDVVVLGLPRGGIPVADAVARALRAPLDVLVVRKLGVPHHEELAMGAIASGGVRVLNADVLRQLAIPPSVVDAVSAREEHEFARREWLYRGDRPPVEIAGQTVIIVDDGLATGSTMRAAIAAVRQRGPARLVAAVPVAARATCQEVGREADEMVCPATPEPFAAVGLWYHDFTATTDQQVRDLLEAAALRSRAELPPARAHDAGEHGVP